MLIKVISAKGVDPQTESTKPLGEWCAHIGKESVLHTSSPYQLTSATTPTYYLLATCTQRDYRATQGQVGQRFTAECYEGPSANTARASHMSLAHHTLYPQPGQVQSHSTLIYKLEYDHISTYTDIVSLP